MIGRDFTCRGELDILVKDLNYVLEMGKTVGAPLLLSAVAKEIYQTASRLGWGKEDDSAVVKAVERLAGSNVHGSSRHGKALKAAQLPGVFWRED
jgi:hypothetical protein